MCEVMSAGRSTVRYVSVRPKQEALRRRLRELTETRVAYGYRRAARAAASRGLEGQCQAGVPFVQRGRADDA